MFRLFRPAYVPQTPTKKSNNTEIIHHNTTLSLFDAALEIPGLDWPKKYMGEGKLQLNTVHLEEGATAKEEAWTNSDFKTLMPLDLVLYEHVVGVFHQQARAYGLE